MRIVPRHWHTETWVCSLRGHALPAATVAELRPEDRRLGVVVDERHRLVRCVRCDSWVELVHPDPGSVSAATVPPLDELEPPRVLSRIVPETISLMSRSRSRRALSCSLKSTDSVRAADSRRSQSTTAICFFWPGASGRL